jgi:membrane protein DedA with SNARE-associated domain
VVVPVTIPDLSALPDLVLYLALAVAALLEYVFPPFPGDTVSVMGGAVAAARGAPLVLAVLALTAGSLVGMTATWRIGRSVGARLVGKADGELVLGLEVGALRKAAVRLEQNGGWLLVLNRFLPSFRALVFVAAGAAGLPLRRVLALGGLSALLWNVLLVGVGVVLGRNAGRIEAWLSNYRVVVLSLLAVVAVVLLGRWLWQRRRA